MTRLTKQKKFNSIIELMGLNYSYRNACTGNDVCNLRFIIEDCQSLTDDVKKQILETHLFFAYNFDVGTGYFPGGDEGIFGWGYFTGGWGFRVTKGTRVMVNYKEKCA